MADSKTSALPAVASVADAQEFPVNDAGTSKKATAAQVKTYIGALVQGPGTAIADNQAVRGDTSGIQGSGITISDADAVSGMTQLDVDNLRVDGNTISSTNTNGDITLDPDGTGNVAIPSANALRFGTGLRLVTPFVQIPANGSLDGSSGNNPASDGADVGMKRAAANGWIDTNGGSGIGWRLSARPVEANTAVAASPNVLAATESRKLLTNEGVTAENYETLPAAAAGIEFEGYAIDSDGQRFTAVAGDEIEVGGAVSATGGFIRLAQNAYVRLVAVNATRWKAAIALGTITVDA